MNRQDMKYRVLQSTLAFLVGGLLAVALLLGSGCTDTMFNEAGDAPPPRSVDDAKFRHAHLMDRALRPGLALAGKRTGNNGRHMGLVVGLGQGLDKQRVLERFRALDRFKTLDRYRVIERWQFDHVFNGFAIEVEDTTGEEFFDEFIAFLLDDDDIDWFEPDILVDFEPQTLGTRQGAGAQTTPWGVDRIAATGQEAGDVAVFVMDTGVTHGDVDLAESIDFTGSPSGAADVDGHGTHVAGTIAAEDDDDGIVGVAPETEIYSLKVVPDVDPDPDNGEVDLSTAIAAVEYATGYKLQNPGTPVVVNVSLGADIGTSQYNALDEAIAASSAAGVVYVVAAGNQGLDASTFSPAHVAEAITVGAYDAGDRFAWFSNHGPVVDILAPGVDVVSLEKGDGQAEVLMSGTSMAAPHVTGAVALFLQQNPHASADQVRQALAASSRAGIAGAPGSTTDKTLDVPALLNVQLPPFFHYAITGGNDLDFFEGVYVGVETNARRNASVFANNNVDLKEPDVLIEGFVYYGNNVQGFVAESVRPRYNPTGLPATQRQPEIPLPSFDPRDHVGAATRAFSDNLVLSGHYELGTREAPAVWYVDGKIVTAGDVSFSGYGILMTGEDIEIEHAISTDAGPGETRLGLYTGNNFKVRTENLDVAAQIFVDNNAEFAGNTTLYGSLTVGNNLKFKGAARIYYRPASAVLTELLWPMQ